MRVSTPARAFILSAVVATSAILAVSHVAADLGGPSPETLDPLTLDGDLVNDEVVFDAYKDHLDKDFEEHMPEEDLQSAFNSADLNGDGYVDVNQ
jgi:Ca2+-binding EF-hand superfamily protein